MLVGSSSEINKELKCVAVLSFFGEKLKFSLFYGDTGPPSYNTDYFMEFPCFLRFTRLFFSRVYEPNKDIFSNIVHHLFKNSTEKNAHYLLSMTKAHSSIPKNPKINALRL